MKMTKIMINKKIEKEVETKKDKNHNLKKHNHPTKNETEINIENENLVDEIQTGPSLEDPRNPQIEVLIKCDQFPVVSIEMVNLK